MAKRLDITLNKVIKLQLADLGARGALSKDKSTMLTPHHPDVWRIMTQRSTPRLRVIQMGYSIGATRLVESQLSLMSNFPQGQTGGREFETVNLYMRDLYICVRSL